MATDYYIELTNIDFSGTSAADPIEYHFELVQNLDESGNIPVTTIESDIPENNQNIGFQGKQRDIVFEWWVYDNGTDKSNGTLSSSGITDSRLSGGTIETITEQKVWLERYIHNATISASWRLFGGKYTDPDGSGNNNGTPVSIVSANIREISSNPSRGIGSMRLQVGQVV